MRGGQNKKITDRDLLPFPFVWLEETYVSVFVLSEWIVGGNTLDFLWMPLNIALNDALHVGGFFFEGNRLKDRF